jgi:hypothetical protein
MSDTHKYRVFVSICTRFECEYSRIPNIRIFANTRDYSRIFAVKNEYEYEYGFARSREYLYLRIYIRYTPCSRVVSAPSPLTVSSASYHKWIGGVQNVRGRAP